MGVYASSKHALEGLSESLDHEVRAFGIRVVLIEPPYTRTNLDASAAQAEGRMDAYALQRHRTAAAITHHTTTAPEPQVVAEAVVRAIEGRYRMRRPIGQAARLSWLRRLLPARLFEPRLRQAFALEPSRQGGVTAACNPEGQPPCSISSAWSSRRDGHADGKLHRGVVVGSVPTALRLRRSAPAGPTSRSWLSWGMLCERQTLMPLSLLISSGTFNCVPATV